MSPGGHLVTTAVACAAVQAATGSAALTAGVAAGGFLIDLDHVLDYVAFERQRDLRPAAFLRYYLAGRTRTVVLLLHSYEILALLALAAWSWNLEWLWGYVLGAAALHLPLDIVFNGKVAGRNMVPFYSLVYRWRARLPDRAPARHAPAGPAAVALLVRLLRGGRGHAEDGGHSAGGAPPASLRSASSF